MIRIRVFFPGEQAQTYEAVTWNTQHGILYFTTESRLVAVATDGTKREEKWFESHTVSGTWSVHDTKPEGLA